MSLHALKTGYMLHEYRIEKLLGEGGFGLTYLAFDTNLEKNVAVKEYMPREHAVRRDSSKILAASESSEKVYNWGLNAFLNEAKTLAKYEDSNIVRIYRFFKANGTAYIVMEYCEGGCLIDRISKNISMNEKVLKKIITEIVHGLQLVHNDGILHRDIKPDNIMFRADDTPVLIDFGAARQAIGDRSKKVTTIITPGYAPLEQYSSSGDIGPWSDIYSLSAVAYLCITGTRPPNIMNRLHDDTVNKLGDKLNSSPFLKAIDSGLQVQIEDRPRSLSEWSANWDQHKPQTSKNNGNSKSSAPIYANKYTGAHKKFVSPQPISARPTSEKDEFTIINDQIASNESNTQGGSKLLTVIILLVILAALVLFTYGFYLKTQRAQPIDIERTTSPTTKIIVKKDSTKKTITKTPVTKTTTTKVSTIKINSIEDDSQILQVQKLLNQLGYPVTEDGVINTRTIESIKAYEKSQKIVVTGSVDSILIQTMYKTLQTVDNQDWEDAKTKLSVSALQAYLEKHPSGAHATKAPILIEDIKVQQQKYTEKLEAEKIARQARIDSQNAIELERQKLQQEQSIKRLNQIASEKKLLVKDIQIQFQRLKFKDLSIDGELDRPMKKMIIAYQKLKGIETNGLPTKSLLYNLKSEIKWPGRLLGEAFQDCPICPAMIVIPAGSYMMGSLNGKPNELPRHNVDIEEFILSKTEITFKQWDACVEDNVCSHSPEDDNLGRKNLAVMRVNYQDIQQFLQWLNNITKKSYRLPTEAEWEYAARAGSTTEYSWGNEIGNNNASCIGCNTGIDNKQINKIKNYPANNYGLFDMHGNLWEWTQDCWHPNYLGAPSDGQAWEPNGCNRFVVRGGSGGNKPEDLRSASRGVIKKEQRLNSIGFRVALDSN